MVSIDWLDWSSKSVSPKSRWMALATSHRDLRGSSVSTRLCQFRVPAMTCLSPSLKQKHTIWLNKVTIRQHSPESSVLIDVHSYHQGMRVRTGWTISVPGWQVAKDWGEDSARTSWLAGLANGPTEHDGNKDGSAAPGIFSVLWKSPHQWKN